MRTVHGFTVSPKRPGLREVQAEGPIVVLLGSEFFGLGPQFGTKEPA